MKKLLLLITFIAFTATTYSLDTEKLDKLMNTLDANNRAMGSLSIAKDGNEIYSKAIGFENIGNKLNATKNTKYRIGSISKTFTAVVIMNLIEEGELALDTKLSKYYPEVENADKITIKQMLKHRSGIYSFTNDENYFDWMESPVSKEELANKINEYDSVFEPDSKAEYSNSNYVLLTFIAENASGESFNKLLEKYILSACELANTYYGGKIGAKPNEAQSYYRDIDWHKATETDMSVPQGAGSIVSTPTDLNKFMTCLFQGKLVSDESLAEMMMIEDGYGAGLFKVPYLEKSAYGHTGGIDGFQSNSFYFTDLNLSISYISNGVSYPVNDILVGVLSIYFGDEYELPEFTEAIEVDEEDLKQYEGTYSSSKLPLKIKIFVKEGKLFGQGTGQPEFAMEAYDLHKFRYEAARIKIEFKPENNQFILFQGGGEFVMTRE